MFQDIYPRGAHDAPGRSTIGLFEELGELAEAIRVFDRFPKYLFGEAADVFSYLMGISNEYALIVQIEHDRVFSFETEYMKRYPGLCPQCGNQICKCPSIPESTVGRMAKELSLKSTETYFFSDYQEMYIKGQQISTLALSRLGRSTNPERPLPFDRGEANIALIELINRLETEAKNPKLREALRNAALKASEAATYAGSKAKSEIITEIMQFLHKVWPELAPAAEKLMHEPENLVSKMAQVLQPEIRVLLVSANPIDSSHLEIDKEMRAIELAIKQSKFRNYISTKFLPAATADDLRIALLESEYDVIHFSGHGSTEGPIFADTSNESMQTSMTELQKFLRRYPTIKCVLINSCNTLKDFKEDLADFTIGMSAPVGDAAAIEFSRGFYDALGAGRDFICAAEEGESAVGLKGLAKNLSLTVLQKK